MTSTLFSEVDPTNEDHFIEIKSFTLDQLRKICTKFSKPRPVKLADAMININDIVNCSDEAFELGQRIAEEKRKEASMRGKLLMRIVRVLYHANFIAHFVKVNDRKKAADHETGFGGKNQYLYANVADVVNDDSSEEHMFLLPCLDEKVVTAYNSYMPDEAMSLAPDHPRGILSIQTNHQEVKDLVQNFFKIQRTIKAMMTTSGNGCNDPMKFVANALTAAKLKGKITQNAAYYFYMQCSFNKNAEHSIEAKLQDDVQALSATEIAANKKRRTKKTMTTLLII